MNEPFKDEIIIAVLERTIRRLWILCIILIVLLVGTNICWIWYENQFEEVVTTTETIEADQSTEDGGNNTVVGGDYGTTEGKNNENDNKTP